MYLQALENDHSFKAAQANRDAGLENKNLGRAGLLPQIEATAGVGQSRIDSNGTEAPPSEPGKFDVDQTNYGVQLRQAIFDMSSWHQYTRGKALTNAAQAEFALAEQNLILRVANAYFDALKAVDNLATAKAEEAALARQLEQTKQRFAVGLTAITEVHEAQAVYDSSVADRLVASGRLGIAFEALEVITGKRTDSLNPLSAQFPVEAPKPAAREEWVNMARESNAALKLASFVKDAEEARAKSAKSEHLPKLSGALSYNGSETNRDDLTAEDQTGTSIRLDLSVPLYTGGRLSASRRQAYSQYLSAKEDYFRTQRDIVQETHSYHLAVLTSAATVKARKQAITSSRSALDATKAGYDVGTRDLVDVLNAQRNVFRAERDYSETLYTYVVASLRLKQAAGVLAAKDVNDLDQWLDPSKPVTYTP
jgi:outer membrane protein